MVHIPENKPKPFRESVSVTVQVFVCHFSGLLHASSEEMRNVQYVPVRFRDRDSVKPKLRTVREREEILRNMLIFQARCPLGIYELHTQTHTH